MYVYQHHPVFTLLLTCNSAQISKSKIEDRFNTYKNDALRYAKLLSKIERFESWGKEKKLAVRQHSSPVSMLANRRNFSSTVSEFA